MLVLSVIYNFIPLSIIIRHFKKLKRKKLYNSTYSELKHLFTTDYDRENPITKMESKVLFQNWIKERKRQEEAKETQPEGDEEEEEKESPSKFSSSFVR